MLELYNNFFTNFSDVNMFEALGMETNSLYFILSERSVSGKLYPNSNGNRVGSFVVTKLQMFLLPVSPSWKILSIEGVVRNTKDMIGERLYSSKRSSDVHQFYVYVLGRNAAMMLHRADINLFVKVSTHVCYSRVVRDIWKRSASSWTDS